MTQNVFDCVWFGGMFERSKIQDILDSVVGVEVVFGPTAEYTVPFVQLWNNKTNCLWHKINYKSLVNACSHIKTFKGISTKDFIKMGIEQVCMPEDLPENAYVLVHYKES